MCKARASEQASVRASIVEYGRTPLNRAKNGNIEFKTV